MKLEVKQYVFDKPENITVEFIEGEIVKSGYEPLRWAIVKVENEKLFIESVVSR